MEVNKKLQLKVYIFGDAMVGKTSLLQRYVNGGFKEGYKATIGADYLYKDVMVKDRLVTMLIWDTPGVERFGREFHRKADACILVYDVTNPESLENLQKRKEAYTEDPWNAKHQAVFVVFGNKADLTDERRLSEKSAKTWCAENGGLPHLSGSAKTGQNVNELLDLVAHMAVAPACAREIRLATASLTPPASECTLCHI